MGDSDHDQPLFWGLGGTVDMADAGLLATDSGTLTTWDIYAWVGDDDVKLRLELEGDHLSNQSTNSESRAFLSWNIAEFLDLETGIRIDDAAGNATWGLIALHGMLPYFLETTATAFVSSEGDVAFRIKQSLELALTQDIFISPHAEINAYLDDVVDYQVGAGASDFETGLQLRYEITRKFAPYIDLVYERELGETSVIKQAHGEDPERTTVRAGLKFSF